MLSNEDKGAGENGFRVSRVSWASEHHHRPGNQVMPEVSFWIAIIALVGSGELTGSSQSICNFTSRSSQIVSAKMRRSRAAVQASLEAAWSCHAFWCFRFMILVAGIFFVDFFFDFGIFFMKISTKNNPKLPKNRTQSCSAPGPIRVPITKLSEFRA